jgi:hypothetical protein
MVFWSAPKNKIHDMTPDRNTIKTGDLYLTKTRIFCAELSDHLMLKFQTIYLKSDCTCWDDPSMAALGT